MSSEDEDNPRSGAYGALWFVVPFLIIAAFFLIFVVLPGVR